MNKIKPNLTKLELSKAFFKLDQDKSGKITLDGILKKFQYFLK